MKVCKGCGVTKRMDEFTSHNTTKDRRAIRCKVCVAKRNRELRLERNPKRKLFIEMLSSGIKTCPRCAETKPLSEFFYNSHTKKQQSHCKVCMRAANREWMRKNPEKNLARKKRFIRPKGYSTEATRKWRAKYPEKYKASNAPTEAKRIRDRERYKNNPIRRASVDRRSKEFANKNPTMGVIRVVRRRTAKRHANVAWANDFFISEAYALARLRTKMLGISYQVDHIVPLQSKIVCGLHVEHNLQVIPRIANISKGNRHWPDMPAGT